ncbi:MAG: hypothetical protein R2684_09650 [Pyrinomonadaceae bacterium]
MLERIYFALWGVYALVLGIFLILGAMDGRAILAFGMIAFGMIFMGMIGVLPIWATHHTEPGH